MTATTTNENNNGLIDIALEGESAEFKNKVYQIIKQTGIRETDPVFPLLVSTSSLKVLLEKAPKEYKSAGDYVTEQLMERLETYKSAASKGIEKNISDSVSSLVDGAMEKAKGSKSKMTFFSLVGAGTIICTSLGLGLVGGWGYSQYQISKQQQMSLTNEQIEALKWATSDQGEFARDMLRWNEDVIDGSCQEKVSQLGVTLNYLGKQAVSGYCFLWVVPSGDRKFEE